MSRLAETRAVWNERAEFHDAGTRIVVLRYGKRCLVEFVLDADDPLPAAVRCEVWWQNVDGVGRAVGAPTRVGQVQTNVRPGPGAGQCNGVAVLPASIAPVNMRKYYYRLMPVW